MIAFLNSISDLLLLQWGEHLQLQQNFNLTAFLGRWYVAYRTGVVAPVSNDVTLFLSRDEIGKMKLDFSEWIPQFNKWSLAVAELTLTRPSRFRASFLGRNETLEYRVLYTDYVNLTLLYMEIDSGHPDSPYKFGWALTRTPQISYEDSVKSLGLFEDRTLFTRSDFFIIYHGVAPMPPPGPTSRVSIVPRQSSSRMAGGRDKCTYHLPMERCMFVGGFIVFDSVQQLCVMQNHGCSLAYTMKMAFTSFEECREACLS